MRRLPSLLPSALWRRLPVLPALLALAITPFVIIQALSAGAGISDADLLRGATELARRYDAGYATRDPAALAAMYTPDAVLIPTTGPALHGRDAIRAFYAGRLAAGAGNHEIKVVEVHVQGNGGYGLAEFSATIPDAHGDFRTVRGNMVAIYQRDPDGWHIRLAEPSVSSQ